MIVSLVKHYAAVLAADQRPCGYVYWSCVVLKGLCHTYSSWLTRRIFVILAYAFITRQVLFSDGEVSVLILLLLVKAKKKAYLSSKSLRHWTAILISVVVIRSSQSLAYSKDRNHQTPTTTCSLPNRVANTDARIDTRGTALRKFIDSHREFWPYLHQ